MRSQLKTVKQIYSFETDIVAQTASLLCEPGFDIKSALDQLAIESDKLAEWSVVEDKD